MKRDNKIFILVITLIVGFIFLFNNTVHAVNNPTLSAEISPDNSTTVDLGWSLADIMPLEYVVFRDGSSITPPTTDMTFFADTNIPIGTYTYEIVVYSSGAEVARSNSVSIDVSGNSNPPNTPNPPNNPTGNIDYFDTNIPGFDICTKLRRLTEEKVNPTVTPPYEVGLFGVDTSTSDSGSTSGTGSVNPCKDCVSAGTVWNNADNTCYDTVPDCNHFGDPAGSCISNEASCPPDSTSGGTASNVATTQGSIFQKWFIDACVMDGYLTEVKHVDLIHRFEIKESIFAEKTSKNEINLGQLFEEAFMEVTNNMDWMNTNTSDLAKDSLKDFTLDVLNETVMESTKAYNNDKNKELAKASLKDFFLAIKDSNEQFTTDLLQAISEKESLNLEYLKSYDLAKIEKAREDVNKLTYETYRELLEEPLIYDKELSGEIIRSVGLKVVDDNALTSCPFGVLIKNGANKECVVVKKEGRIINNADDFIYEEPIQKARNFLMCFFAPERHFPIGEDYNFASIQAELDEYKNKIDKPGKPHDQLKDGTIVEKVLNNANPYCGKSATKKIMDASCKNKCEDNTTGKYIFESNDIKAIRDCRKCVREKMDDQCNYETICEEARNNAGTRPDMFEPSYPTKFDEYVKKLCPSDQIKETIKRDMLLELARKYKFLYNAPPEHWYYIDPSRCALILGNLGYDIGGTVIGTLGDSLRDNTTLAYQAYQKKVWKTELPIAIAYRPDPTDKDYALQKLSLTASTKFGFQSYAQSILNRIIGEYQSLRNTEYLSGEGLRNEKYLVGYPDRDGKYFFVDTENITSPALFLKDKIAAATQAQFDLAEMAWKQNPDNGNGNWTCPQPFAGNNLNKNDFDTPPGPYNNLINICKNAGLKHGWYLVDLNPSETDAKKKKYECRWPQFNNITCGVFGYVTTPAIKDAKTLPNELPAPWEDFNDYMKVPDSYLASTSSNAGWIDKNRGLRKTPPAFDTQEYYDAYSSQTLDQVYPEIYGKAYGENVPWPAKSDSYYTNKWYKGMTQLYEKPMSEILRTWFKKE